MTLNDSTAPLSTEMSVDSGSAAAAEVYCFAAHRYRRWFVLGLVTWFAAVVAGTAFLVGHANRPGASATPPLQWAAVTDASPTYRLLMFAHPRCPCTAASLQELARILVRCPSGVETTVYFFHPASVAEDWTHGATRDLAVAIPGVRVVLDPGGTTAGRFGSKTSGDVLLYDAAGRLRFHGGITSARGHEGDSLGKSAVISLLRGENGLVESVPVFGCVIRPTSEGRDDAE